MSDNEFQDIDSSFTTDNSSFGWVSMGSEENINASNKPENQSDQDITDFSDSSSDNGSYSKKSDLKSFNKGITIKKERNTHQLSEDESDSSPKFESKKEKNHCKTEKGEPNHIVPKIYIDGVLDTSEGIPLDLDSDDDIWVVQCPANVQESDLKGNTMDFNGISTFGSNYIGTSLRQKSGVKSSINLLIPNKHFELKTVAVAGHVIITQKVDVPTLELPAVKPKTATPLPEGLKLRHPLLGCADSSGGSCDYDAPHTKKKKKHKHVDSSQTTYSDLEISPSPSKKKKKKKDMSQSESIEMAQHIIKKEKECSDSERSHSPFKKKKKKNKNNLSPPESVEMILKITKKEKESSDSEISTSPNKKKKKKINDLSQSESIEMIKNVNKKEKEYSCIDISPSPNKKKKKKKKEHPESIEMAQDIYKKEENSESEDIIESSQVTKTIELSPNGSKITVPLSQFFDDSHNSSYERKNNKKKRNKCDLDLSVQGEGLVTEIHFKKEKKQSESDESISLLNTSINKKNAKKNVEFLPKSSALSPKRLTMKRRLAENEVNGVSPKKKKLKLSLSQDGE